MTTLETRHATVDATFGERMGTQVVEHFGRPERTHRAVRNGVGVIETVHGIVAIEGDDRLEYVDNVVSNRVPDDDGEGCYALVLDPQGRIDVELWIYNAGDRLLLFIPPNRVDDLVTDWSEKVFIQDVDIRVLSDEFGTFELHGPSATEKIASIFTGSSTPDRHHSFVRGAINDVGVTVIRGDALTGEESYRIVCSIDDGDTVYDALQNYGMVAVPFGYQTYDTLTLEAGSPLFETELQGHIPNTFDFPNAIDFEKGCFIGQEVVSRIENRGHPSHEMIGVSISDDHVPEAGTPVLAEDDSIGEITRAARSPLLETPIALARIEYGSDVDTENFAVRIEREAVSVSPHELPFVDGSDRSDRLPALSD